jgi:hypothetical protein
VTNAWCQSEDLNTYSFRFPEFTQESNLQRFRGSVVRGNPHDNLKSYIQRAVASEGLAEAIRCEVEVIQMDCLTELSSLDASTFCGAEIIFADLPKV